MSAFSEMASSLQPNERTKLLAREDADGAAAATKKSSQTRVKTAGLLVLLGMSFVFCGLLMVY